MALQTTVDSIKLLLQRNDIVYIMNDEAKGRIHKFIEMATQQFDVLEAEKPVEVTDKDLQIATYCLDSIKYIVLNNVITDLVKELAENICRLLFNWNYNIGKDSTIHKDVKFVDSVLSQHYTIVDAISVLKRTISTLERRVTNIDSSVSVSRHYMEAVDAILASEGADEK